MSLSLEVEGLKELQRDMAQTKANIKPLMTAVLFNAGRQTQRNVRLRAPHQTGALQRSVISTVDYPVGQVEVTEKYGAYIEQGTGIFGPKRRPIVPRTAKALAFKVNGSMVFARSVKGQRAKPFFRPGVEDSLTYIEEQFKKFFNRVADGIMGRN